MLWVVITMETFDFISYYSLGIRLLSEITLNATFAHLFFFYSFVIYLKLNLYMLPFSDLFLYEHYY